MDTLKEIISALGEEQVFMRDSKEGIESGSESDSKLSMKNFGPIFQEFCGREAIYGFGDLQVLGMVEQLQKSL